MLHSNLEEVGSAVKLDKPRSHGIRALDIGSQIGAELLGGIVAESLRCTYRVGLRQVIKLNASVHYK